MNGPLPVILNAGPLMALAKLNALHLLQKLYGQVLIPRSVYDEVVLEGLRQGYEDARTLHLFLAQVQWNPVDVDRALIPQDLLQAPLDRGERDTLALAVEMGGALVLMDETVGRKAARARGLPVRGSLGILIEAYRRGLIEDGQLRLYFDAMAHRQDIWISPALAARLLSDVLGT